MSLHKYYNGPRDMFRAIKFVPEYRAIIMKRLLFIFTFFCLLAIHGGAQNILTLENCLRIGIENNLSLQGKRKAMQKICLLSKRKFQIQNRKVFRKSRSILHTK